jgi:hypothetical protein
MPALSKALVGAGAAAVCWLAWRQPRWLRASTARLACLTLIFYATVTPLSWRWFTFIWMPVAFVASADALARRDRFAATLLAAFFLNVTLLQAVVARALGIPEVDELSFIGLYCLGNILLLLAAAQGFRVPAHEHAAHARHRN